MKTLKVCTALLSAALLGSALAGQIRELNSTQAGTGQISYASRYETNQIRRMQVMLRANGDAEIRVLTAPVQTIYGHWRSTSNNTVHVDIDRVNRDPANGSGTIELDGRSGRFNSLTLTGTVRSEPRFTIDFNSGKRSYTIDNSNSTREGRGVISIDGRNRDTDVRRMSVNLRDDGTFEIRALSPTGERWSGTWYTDRNNRVRLNIDKMSRDNATGTGYVDFDGRGAFTRVSIDGRLQSNRRDFSLDFNASGAGWGEDVNYGRDRIGQYLPSGTFEFASSHEGNGYLKYNGTTYKIESARVSMSRNGSIVINVSGDINDTWRGRWTGTGTKLNISITDAMGRATNDGSGTIDLVKQKDDWWRFDISGQATRGGYHLFFRK